MHRHDRGVSVDRLANDNSAAERARWLAELAVALDDARHIVNALGAARGEIESVELFARIEAVRLQVQAMRLRRSYGGEREFRPEWIDNVLWKRSA